MKVKNILIYFSIILVFFVTILALETAVNATEGEGNGGIGVDSIISNMSDIQNPLSVNPGGEASGIARVINIIIGLLQIAGSGISVLVVTILGIKYILASVEEKAEIKKQAVPIVIGCVLLFGAVNLMAALQDFTNITLQTTTSNT